MSTPRKIAIVIGTTREGRFGDRPAQWMLDRARAHGGATFELVDLRDHPLPFFNETTSPMWAPPVNEEARRWAARMADFDGYIFITAEYNHSISGVLKNALDHLSREVARKPAAFVGYGGVGAARAVEQLRLMAVELHLAPLRNAVHIGMVEFLGLLREGKDFADYPHLGQSADALLDDLIWWTDTLKAGRDVKAQAA